MRVTASVVTGIPSRNLPIRVSAAWASASRRGSPKNPQVPLIVWTSRKRCCGESLRCWARARSGRARHILGELERSAAEPEGSDGDLIGSLDRLACAEQSLVEAEAEPKTATATVIGQGPERALKPGEVSLEELERAFRETPGPEPEVAVEPPPAEAASERASIAGPSAPKADADAGEAAAVSKVQTIG